jgi:hypothetical protein
MSDEFDEHPTSEELKASRKRVIGDEFDQHPTLEEAKETARKTSGNTHDERVRNTWGENVVPFKEAPGDDDNPRFSDPTQSNKWFNERFHVITDGGVTRVYKILKNGRAESYKSNEDFFAAWTHIKLQIMSTSPTQLVTLKFVEVARNWFYKFPNRATFQSATFDPNNAAPPNVWNFWPGFGTKPIKGDCHLALEYFKDVLCGGIDEEYQWLKNWCAHLVQKPGEKPGTSIVIPGEGEGTGKSMFPMILSVLIDGKDQDPYLFFSTSNARLVSGDFTGHLRHCLLLHSEEALRPDSEKENSIIKNLITESVFGFHAKFKDAKASKNYVRLIFSGNQPHIVRASRTSRRYFIPSISSDRMQDHTYFGALIDELNNGGYEALMYELMNTDISRYDVRNAPITEGLLGQRGESHKGPEAFWIDILNTGQLNVDDKSLNRFYPSISKEYWCNDEVTGKDLMGNVTVINRLVNEYHVIKNRLFVKFQRFEGHSPYRDRSLETSFGAHFCKFFSKTPGFELEKVKIGKFNYYIIPPLIVARQCMCDYLGYKYNFDVTVTEWGDEPFV